MFPYSFSLSLSALQFTISAMRSQRASKISIRKSPNQAAAATTTAKEACHIVSTTTTTTTILATGTAMATHTQPDFNQIHSIVCLSSKNGRLSQAQDEQEEGGRGLPQFFELLLLLGQIPSAFHTPPPQAIHEQLQEQQQQQQAGRQAGRPTGHKPAPYCAITIARNHSCPQALSTHPLIAKLLYGVPFAADQNNKMRCFITLAVICTIYKTHEYH